MKIYFKIKAVLFGCIILVLSSGCDDSIRPVVGQWEYLGLKKKLVNSLVVYDEYLYACAGRDGLYRLDISKNSGDWEYLGFADSGLFRGLEYGVTSLIQIPSTKDLLVSINTHRFDKVEIGLYRSTDNGVTWIPSDDGFRTGENSNSAKILTLSIDPSSPDNIYAGLEATIFKSIDGGASWKLSYGNLAAGGLGINTIKIPNNSTNEVWAGGETGRFAPLVVHSINNGESWNRDVVFPDGFGPYYIDNAVYDIEIDPTDENTIYFGMLGLIAKSSDKGQTFQKILGWDNGIFRYWEIEINPYNSKELISTGKFLYISKDSGKSWSEYSPSNNLYEFYALYVDWNKRVAYVSASSPENGIYKLNF